MNNYKLRSLKINICANTFIHPIVAYYLKQTIDK